MNNNEAEPRTLGAAYSQLHDPLCQFVRRRAAAMNGRLDLARGAEDVVQRVFEAAVATGWDTIGQPRAWLYAVARRHLQAMATWQRAELHGPAMSWSTEVGVAAIVAGHTLSALPTRQRQIAYLRFHERWTFTEIAAALGISESTARAHAHGPGDRPRVPLERTEIRRAVLFPLRRLWWIGKEVIRRRRPAEVRRG
ncbi:RNA polymerase sigma factor [Amycolatopsis sp. YIM 10]|uniref:RNA polymerase sigma factor n=1 Tax=Amycolatopsis sp. YIM 10 TaxID=2653857 RepID=UPI0012A7ED5B|nr:sigma-70 family RNA polymerase sigma factor [Amycolatopsis sp. YIM 10]QFU90188.1 RNA polymerase sigma factor [Amycolatopsis sp. YIM 10]